MHYTRKDAQEMHTLQQAQLCSSFSLCCGGALGAHTPLYVPPGPDGGGAGGAASALPVPSVQAPQGSQGQERGWRQCPESPPSRKARLGSARLGSARLGSARPGSARPRSLAPSPPLPFPAHFQCRGRHRSAANQSETALSRLVIGAELRPRPAYYPLRVGGGALKGPGQENAGWVGFPAVTRWLLLRFGTSDGATRRDPDPAVCGSSVTGFTDNTTWGPTPTGTGPVKPPLTREFAYRCPGGGSKQQACGMGDLPGSGMGAQRGHSGAGTRDGTRHDLHKQS